jgi:hypothetical protein
VAHTKHAAGTRNLLAVASSFVRLTAASLSPLSSGTLEAAPLGCANCRAGGGSMSRRNGLRRVLCVTLRTFWSPLPFLATAALR